MQVIEADGRKIKNIAAESRFAYLMFPSMFIFAGRVELWEIIREPCKQLV